MNEFRLNKKLMGSAFELIIAHEDSGFAHAMLEKGVAEIERLEALLSEFRDSSVTSFINANAWQTPVEIDTEVFSLIQRSLHLSCITQGAFDISVGPLKKIYRFKNSGFEFPDDKTIKEALLKTGYDKIHLHHNEVKISLEHEDMFISFAAIGKGYAADCVKKLWLKEGVESGVISASGDLTTIGRRADGTPWRIGIADPDNMDKMLFYIPVSNASVATSGDYVQHFMHKGIRYSHNINPVSGLPVSGIKSVSVISPAAELCDALATAVTVMGIDTGLHFIDQLPDTHCIIIDDHNRCHFSRKIEVLREEKQLDTLEITA